MYWSISSLIALMSGVFLLSFIYFYLFMHYKERYILIWAFSWLCYALGYVFAFWYAAQMKSEFLIILNQMSLVFSGLLLLVGTYEFTGGVMPKVWIYTAILDSLWVLYAVSSDLSIRFLTFPTYQFLGWIYIWTGWVIFLSRTFQGIGRRITGTSFMIWGIYKLILPFLDETWLTPWGYMISWLAPWGFLISMVMTLMVAIGILLAFFNRVGLELQKSEERFRLLAENARDIIYRFSLKSSIKINYISPASASILGYTPTELYGKGKNILKLVFSEDRKLLIRLIKNPEIRTETLRWVHKDGSLIWIEHNNVPIYDEKGSIRAVEGIARDITKRKKAEVEMLEARERVARAERMASLGSMAAGIAHEINQPLNSIKVNADSLIYLDRIKAPIERGEIMENIRDISVQVTRIDDIIKHMRSFIQPDLPQKKQDCDLNRAVESALSLIGIQLASHQITLVKDLQEKLPIIEAQSIHLEEIIINLMINAMQALDKLEKNYKQIICRTYTDVGCLVLEISDNGPGIDESIKEKIFEPFFSTNTIGENMGLGLCIVHSIVDSYQGTIFFHSNDMGGTTFRILFPLTEKIAQN